MARMKQGDLFEYSGNGSPRSRADQIYKRFEQFHKDNPNVWRLLKKFANDLVEAGFEHYSVDAVVERIRWHVNIETRSHEGLKLNNDFRAYYARLFHVAFPEHAGFFRNRKLTSAETPAYEEDIAFCPTGKPEAEAELNAKLEKLL
jgi:hypothetical protein